MAKTPKNPLTQERNLPTPDQIKTLTAESEIEHLPTGGLLSQLFQIWVNKEKREAQGKKFKEKDKEEKVKETFKKILEQNAPDEHKDAAVRRGTLGFYGLKDLEDEHKFEHAITVFSNFLKFGEKNPAVFNSFMDEKGAFGNVSIPKMRQHVNMSLKRDVKAEAKEDKGKEKELEKKHEEREKRMEGFMEKAAEILEKIAPEWLSFLFEAKRKRKKEGRVSSGKLAWMGGLAGVMGFLNSGDDSNFFGHIFDKLLPGLTSKDENGHSTIGDLKDKFGIDSLMENFGGGINRTLMGGMAASMFGLTPNKLLGLLGPVLGGAGNMIGGAGKAIGQSSPMEFMKGLGGGLMSGGLGKLLFGMMGFSMAAGSIYWMLTSDDPLKDLRIVFENLADLIGSMLSSLSKSWVGKQIGMTPFEYTSFKDKRAKAADGRHQKDDDANAANPNVDKSQLPTIQWNRDTNSTAEVLSAIENMKDGDMVNFVVDGKSDAIRVGDLRKGMEEEGVSQAMQMFKMGLTLSGGKINNLKQMLMRGTFDYVGSDVLTGFLGNTASKIGNTIRNFGGSPSWAPEAPSADQNADVFARTEEYRANPPEIKPTEAEIMASKRAMMERMQQTDKAPEGYGRRAPVIIQGGSTTNVQQNSGGGGGRAQGSGVGSATSAPNPVWGQSLWGLFGIAP